MIVTLIGTALILTGVLILRASWQRRRPKPRWPVTAGWTAIMISMIAFSTDVQTTLGLTHALLAMSLVAYGVVAASIEIRSRKQKTDTDTDIALEPAQRNTNWRRGTAKALLAMVLAGVASIGIGVAFAVVAPMPPVDRILMGGVLVPLSWGGGMAWTLSDPKLVRATLLLVAVSIVSYATAFLPKFLT